MKLKPGLCHPARKRIVPILQVPEAAKSTLIMLLQRSTTAAADL